MKTLGKTFLDNFQSQAAPQTTPQAAPAPNPLSTKAGLNRTKVTSMQQGMLQALAQPQMGAMQNGNS